MIHFAVIEDEREREREREREKRDATQGNGVSQLIAVVARSEGCRRGEKKLFATASFTVN